MKPILKFLFFFCLIVSFYIHAHTKDIQKKPCYEHVVTEIPQSIHILKIDPSDFTIVPARALDDGIGRESVLSLSTRYHAVASINGGFFQIGGNFDGVSLGILKIGDQWVSLPCKPRGAIGWSRNDRLVLIDQVLASCSVTIKDMLVSVDGMNRQRKKGEKILYTPSFHRTSLTTPNGREILVKNNKIDEIVYGRGSNVIPVNGWILSVDESAEASCISSCARGVTSLVSFAIFPQSKPTYTTAVDWAKMDYIVGGTPVLVRNGKALTDFSSEMTIESFLTERHPRTAIGLLKDARWVFVVVDGRQPGVSEGMTMNELAKFMVECGCVEALNLDGGGSSTMVMNGTVVNKPCADKDGFEGEGLERRVSDAILILDNSHF